MREYHDIVDEAVKRARIEKRYYFPGLGFDVRCDSADLLHRVDRFLDPHLLSEGNGLEREWKVFYSLGDVPAERRTEQRIIGTYGTGSVVTAGFREEGGVYYYHNNESGNETIINPGEREAFVVYAGNGIDLNLIEDCYAIVRTICYDHLCRIGAVLIHGCAMRYNNQTVLLAGDKGAGKTVVQHYLLQELRADFISADRTIAWVDDGRVVCTGWISTYRPDIRIFDILAGSAGMKRFQEYYMRKRDDPLYFQNNKIRIAPGELTDMLDIDAVPVSGMDVIIILDDPGAGDSYALEEVDVDRAETVFSRFMIDLKEQGVDSPMHGERRDARTVSYTMERFLAGQIRFYRLTGRGRLDEVESLFMKL